MPVALALFAHPDDIEFRAAGTLLLLRKAGWEIHYWNLSSGNLGSSVMTPGKTARVRAQEARDSAALMGAVWHPPIGHDLQLFYTDEAIRRVCAVVREVKPTILLTHPPQDYMEDHMTTCRLAVTGSFGRNIPNYRSIPSRPISTEWMAIYHSFPHGLCGPLREEFVPDLWVDTQSVHAAKRDALACHRSQKEWLDASQGMDSYLVALDQEAALLGKRSRRFKQAEGWRQHVHPGFGPEGYDPLREALGRAVHVVGSSPSRSQSQSGPRKI